MRHGPDGRKGRLDWGRWSGFRRSSCRRIHETARNSFELLYHNHILINSLTQQRQAAVAAVAMKNRFLASAAHDMRQPVLALSLYADWLRNEPELVLELAPKIVRATHAVNALFDSMFDLARIDSGQVRLHIEQVDVSELLHDLELQYRPVAESKGLEFRVPTFNQLYNGKTESINTGAGIVDPARCPSLTVNPAPGNPCNAITGFDTWSGGRADLKPEESKMGNVGFIWQPIPEFSATVDLWDINISSLEEWGEDAAPSRFQASNHQAPWTSEVRRVAAVPVVGVGRYTDPDDFGARLHRARHRFDTSLSSSKRTQPSTPFRDPSELHERRGASRSREACGHYAIGTTFSQASGRYVRFARACRMHRRLASGKSADSECSAASDGRLESLDSIRWRVVPNPVRR